MQNFVTQKLTIENEKKFPECDIKVVRIHQLAEITACPWHKKAASTACRQGVSK